MSFTATSLFETVGKQYFFKLRANIDAFSAMVGTQLLAVLFSLGGVNSFGMSGGWLEVNVKYYTSDIIIVFTALWAFVNSITVSSRVNRNQDFTFVTNRLSSSLSNILFLATASLLGSITANLAGNLLKIIVYLFINNELYSSNGGAGNLLTGIIATFLYVLLASSIGYLVGALVQLNKAFVLIIPVLILGSGFLSEFVQNQSFMKDAIKFFVDEKNLLVFAVKILASAAALYTVAIGIFNRLEVKR